MANFVRLRCCLRAVQGVDFYATRFKVNAIISTLTQSVILSGYRDTSVISMSKENEKEEIERGINGFPAETIQCEIVIN